MAELDDPIAYLSKASSDPDTMYMADAMKEPDARQFKEAMVKEIQDHTVRKHWKVIEKKDLPKDSLGILDLKNNSLTKIGHIKSYKLPEKWTGYLAYQLEEIKKWQH